ncbi:hypothetical protein SAMN05443582_1011080 [Phyllobacterium sp. OV277]|nr:hypothetical protein SAMN05443582_1011080 [Phyllobacterium sp. OV277]
MVRGSWFDRLTMRGLGGCNVNRREGAEFNSLIATIPVILGLDPRTHGKGNPTNLKLDAFKLWVLGSSPRMTELGGMGGAKFCDVGD